MHHLLLRELGGHPPGDDQRQPLRRADRLRGSTTPSSDSRGIADLFLTHDRPIHLRCDDSVTRIVAGAELPVRRSRGDAPQPIRLPIACRMPTLALGGQLKVTFALGRGRHAFLSHHLGDLDHYEAYRAYGEAIAHYRAALRPAAPSCLVHDLHPDYASTRYARAITRDAHPTIAVQHHHAHMASCMAENGLDEPVIGVAFDGTGFGTDGAIWGGEFLDRRLPSASAGRPTCAPSPCRAASRRSASPGGWRRPTCSTPGWTSTLSHRFGASPSLATAHVEQMLERRFNSPLTSSAGRLFDAVAALAGVRQRVSYEGQAAIELEWLAPRASQPDGAYPFEIEEAARTAWSEPDLVLDTRPLIAAGRRRGARGAPTRAASPGGSIRRWSRSIAQVCGRLRAETGAGRGGPQRRRVPECPADDRGDRAAGGRRVPGLPASPGAAERRRASAWASSPSRRPGRRTGGG